MLRHCVNSRLPAQALRTSLLGVNLVKAAAIGKVGFVGFFPTTEGLLNGEQFELGQPLERAVLANEVFRFKKPDRP